ncbi:MAG TPA: efflux RND transporter periplasmic adaptor subunit [Gemmataceae bacterium]|nr:efflux RND transporter periplasmic adaptor subunit [Gemmataceae bacterium]
MRFPVKTTVLLVVVGGAAAAFAPVQQYWKDRHRPQFQEEEVTRGQIFFEVNSTGTVQPVLSVHIGSFVSGPIVELHVEFNQQVNKGDLLAKIDPLLYVSNVQRDEAQLDTREADVDRVKALLQQAVNEERRALSLRDKNKDFVSETEMDQYRFNHLSLVAQLKLAEAAVKQAQASLDSSKVNLAYTEIRSPVDGIVIDRKIDPGQTLAAQFQTPELFIIAPDMKKEMYVMASVDEADIGLLRQAQETKQAVHFTVDAYPDDLFEGKISQIRMNSTTTQNVVTYPVVVSAPNPDMKLMPGMTANISFQISDKGGVLRIPNAALRFYPKSEQVRQEDRSLLEGLSPQAEKEKDKQTQEATPSARDKAATNRKRNCRHVWVQDGEFLRAVEIVTGINDSKYTEVVSGDLSPETKVVTGIKTKP